MKQNWRKYLSGLLVAVFLLSTVMLAVSAIDKKRSAEAYAQAAQLAGLNAELPTQSTFPSEATEPVAEPAAPEARWIPAPVTDDPVMDALAATDLAALRKENDQVVGWIHIPDTKVHYPITQGSDNTHYLTHSWNGDASLSGAIFMETRNKADLTDFHTIIYGHNMKNSSMFAALHAYDTLTYWAKHRYIYVVTDDGVLRYEVFSFYNADTNSPTYRLSFQQESTREDFIAMALENTEVPLGHTPATTDRFLTLSTCTGLGYSQRRVVHAYLPMVQAQ